MIVFALVCVYVSIDVFLKKRVLRKKGNIYIAIQLVFDKGTSVEKNKICEIDLFELDREVSSIVNQSLTIKSTRSVILKSKLKIIHKYYLQALKENLFDEARKKQKAHN